MAETRWDGLSPELRKKLDEMTMADIDRMARDQARIVTGVDLAATPPPTTLTVEDVRRAGKMLQQAAAQQASTHAMREALDEPTPFVRAARRALPPEDRYKADPEFRNLIADLVRVVEKGRWGETEVVVEDIQAAAAMLPKIIAEREAARNRQQEQDVKFREGRLTATQVRKAVDDVRRAAYKPYYGPIGKKSWMDW